MQVSFAALGFVVVGLCASCSQPVSPTTPSPIQSTTASLTLAGENAPTVTERAVTDHAAQEVPFKGTLEGRVTLHFDQPPFLWWSMSGSGNATQLGRFALEVVSRLGIPHAGYYQFTAANGDRLNAFFVAGPAQTDASSSIVEHADVFDGSGRFAGATGTFTIKRLFDANTGTTTGSFEGTLSYGGGPNQ